MSDSLTNRLRDCIRICWECRTHCHETLFTYCLPKGGDHAAADHVRTMTDCIAICQLAADFMTRHSPLHASVCAACADICEACAQACDRLEDHKMKHCADICRQCADACRDMGGRRRQAA